MTFFCGNNRDYVRTEVFFEKAKTCHHWIGADVAIDKEKHKDLIAWLEGSSIRSENPTAGKNATITEYYLELSQLFYELKYIFKPVINTWNKYYFYGSLIIAANKYLEKKQ